MKQWILVVRYDKLVYTVELKRQRMYLLHIWYNMTGTDNRSMMLSNATAAGRNVLFCLRIAGFMIYMNMF